MAIKRIRNKNVPRVYVRIELTDIIFNKKKKSQEEEYKRVSLLYIGLYIYRIETPINGRAAEHKM